MQATPELQLAQAMSRNPDVLLAFDFGLARIGIATGNRLTSTATPLTTLGQARGLDWNALDRVIADWQPNLLVVGLPAGQAEKAINKRIVDFIASLRKRYALDVETVDEAHSSTAAESSLREGRRTGVHRRRITKGRVDQHAACLIAEQWMAEAADGR